MRQSRARAPAFDYHSPSSHFERLTDRRTHSCMHQCAACAGGGYAGATPFRCSAIARGSAPAVSSETHCRHPSKQCARQLFVRTPVSSHRRVFPRVPVPCCATHVLHVAKSAPHHRVRETARPPCARGRDARAAAYILYSVRPPVVSALFASALAHTASDHLRRTQVGGSGSPRHTVCEPVSVARGVRAQPPQIFPCVSAVPFVRATPASTGPTARVPDTSLFHGLLTFRASLLARVLYAAIPSFRKHTTTLSRAISFWAHRSRKLNFSSPPSFLHSLFKFYCRSVYSRLSRRSRR